MLGTYTSSIEFVTLMYGLDRLNRRGRQTLTALLKVPFHNL